MTQDTSNRLHTLIDRLSRVLASDDWADGLNPAQRSALSFLARANRFSRSPSHLADYMCTTRGTASQTLKALAGKELIERDAPTGDKRSIAYRLTASGAKIAGRTEASQRKPTAPGNADDQKLEEGLTALLRAQLKAHSFRSFGICKTCKYHDADGGKRYCRLLEVTLTQQDATQICTEHAPSQ